MSNGRRRISAAAVAVVGAVLLAACSSGSGDTPSQSPTPVDPSVSPASASRPALPPPNAENPDSAAVDAALAGLSQEQAESAAAAAGYTVRIASVDGEPRALTMDYRFDRINLELESGTVTAANVG